MGDDAPAPPSALDGLVLGLSAPVALACFIVPDDRDATARALLRLGVASADFALYHTRWGQPRLRRRPSSGQGRFQPPDSRTRQQVRHTRPMISLSDDGDVRVAAVACSAAIVGLGLDILDLRRLDRYRTDTEARRRMERRLCAPAEIATDISASGACGGVTLASRFAFKEATSKALGTGLRLGLGLGAGHGVRPQEILVAPTEIGADIRLMGRAKSRSDRLGVSRIEARGYVHFPLLVAVVLLRR